MGDMLADAAEWLGDVLHTHASRSIAYVRGAESLDLKATIGQTEFGIADESGMVVTHQSRDFLILAADLILSGLQAEPARGDQIQERQADGQVLVYEVMAPGGMQPWRYSDPHRIVMRVHTKQVT